MDSATTERGIGIVFFDRDLGADRAVRADTLVIRRDTLRDAVAARWIVRGNGLAWQYELETRDSVASGALEFGYEVEGLPVTRATDDQRWVEVFYGIAADSSPRLGWVRLLPGRVKFRLWPMMLEERNLFFVEGTVPRFHGAPGGPPVRFALDTGANGQPDYIMHPLEVRGRWMQVRVTTPADICGASEAVRQSVLWIRYLDDADRPRVWYYTRGC